MAAGKVVPIAPRKACTFADFNAFGGRCSANDFEWSEEHCAKTWRIYSSSS